ncbi:MAG TPA: cyanophycin synthetase, partial [Armatimonadota bacterium]|nr:cyanophycin synthetase [Armatimonadota bacterium]
ILKPGVPCVFAPQAPAVAALLADRASAVDAPVATFPSVQVEGEQDRFTIHAGATYHGLRLPLQGDHQRENAAVALALAELLATPDVPIRPDAVRRALAEVVWPGRFQVVDGHPTTVLDVAHNAISARVLREGLEQLLADRAGRLICVVGMAKDKDIAGFAETLLPIAAHVVCTRATSGRAADAEAIRAVAANSCTRAIAVDGVGQAIDRARDLAGPADVICVTGSFHVVGEAMEALDIEV